MDIITEENEYNAKTEPSGTNQQTGPCHDQDNTSQRRVVNNDKTGLRKKRPIYIFIYPILRPVLGNNES